MSAVLMSILMTLKGVLFKVIVEQMIMSLVKNDKFVKKLVLSGLEKLVASTETKADDKLLEEAKKAWELDA